MLFKGIVQTVDKSITVILEQSTDSSPSINILWCENLLVCNKQINHQESLILNYHLWTTYESIIHNFASSDTHSAQRIHRQVSRCFMLNFLKSFSMKNYTTSWMAWGWVSFHQIFVCGWTNPLNCLLFVLCIIKKIIPVWDNSLDDLPYVNNLSCLLGEIQLWTVMWPDKPLACGYANSCCGISDSRTVILSDTSTEECRDN